MADTGLVAPLMLNSEKSAYDPGFYRAEIYFSSKKDKYDSPIPTVKIAGDSLGEYTPDLLAQAS
ncbi:hypothetical protein RIE95_11710 [Acidithiobacillus thiooxidans]|uniref:hypothetical protein n=1 Tax=Acidithiobacillus thiooxidans TaxID=930 RepID=UPI00285D34B0|nr:hypothetical protein [Acidithiobacillus thiooxidans]MDR7927642.1 hypothetical protein [Acidithiobacillus thiooxidans]